jgi:hypothetical protein
VEIWEPSVCREIESDIVRSRFNEMSVFGEAVSILEKASTVSTESAESTESTGVANVRSVGRDAGGGIEIARGLNSTILRLFCLPRTIVLDLR